jgi:hemerythrin
MFTEANFVHYKTGVADIDDEHWKLMMLMNNVLALVRDGGCDPVKEATVVLKQHLLEHQVEEEQFMKDIQYPYTEFHIIAHRRQIAAMESMIDNFCRGTPVVHFVNELQHQFAGHIDEYDMGYARWLKENNIDVTDHK